MEINENRIYCNTNRIKKSLFNLSHKKFKTNINNEFKHSRNLFPKTKYKTSLNFNILSFNKSLDTSNKNKKSYSSNINYFSNNKINSINFVNFDMNYLKKISSKYNGNKNKVNDLCRLVEQKDKKRKTDLIKFKFLFGQKIYFKRFFQHYNFGLSSYSSERINQYNFIDKQKYIKKAKSEQNSLKKINFSPNNKTNYVRIKLKKSRKLNSLKEPNELLFDNDNNKNFIKSKNYISNLFKKFKKKREQEKIIDDNYNEYLKNISSSDSKISIREPKDICKIKKININDKLKKLEFSTNKFSLSDKTDIYNNINIRNNNFSYVTFKKDKIFKFREFISYRRKILEQINESIAKENSILIKKVLNE